MKLLILDHAGTVSEIILQTLDETGYTSPEEAIPGLVQAIITLAYGNADLLMEAGDLLADGGIE